MGWQDFSWRTATPQAKRLIIGAGIAVLVAGAYEAGRSGSPSASPASQGVASQRASQPPTADGTGPLQTASTGPGPIPLTQLSSGTCSTFAPEGWKITDQNKDGTVFSVASPDGLIGAYGGMAIGTGQVQGYYGPQFRTPEILTAWLVQQMIGEAPQTEGAPEAIGAYQATKFKTASHTGYYLTYRFPLPADPGGYGLIFRIAIGKAGDEHSVGVAGAAAAAIRCSAVLHPSEGPVYHAPRDTAHGADHTGGGSDSDLAGTYNAQLGTGWVHDRGTGQNYNVDTTTDWRENGPDGPGYYKQNGNDVTKLEAGMAN